MFLIWSAYSHFLFTGERPLLAQMTASRFCCGSAALSALEVCTLMGFIDLNNIRGCGDVIKAEITSV